MNMDQSPSPTDHHQQQPSAASTTATILNSSVVVIGGTNNNNNNSINGVCSKSTISIKQEENVPDLDEMFRIIRSGATNGNPSAISRGGIGSTPMRQRNLPASFFQPPETGSRSNTHSRESSFDHAGSGGPFSPMNPASPMSCPMSPGLMANLSIQGSPAPMSSTSSSSLSSNSTFSNSSNGNSNGQVPQPSASPLPSVLNRANNNGSNTRINIITTNNGQNSVTISAAAPGLMSVHSRAHSSPAQLTAFSVAPGTIGVGGGTVGPQHGASISGISTIHSRQLSYDIDKMKLPDGWEMSVCKNTGKRYFIDHANKTTTWDDPRMTLLREQMEKTHQNQLAVQRQQQQLARLSMSSGMGSSGGLNGSGGSLGHGAGGGSGHSIGHNGGSNQNLGPLPEGWEERSTPSGEPYFVNHQDRSTTWQDPRIARESNNVHRAPPPGIAAAFGANSMTHIGGMVSPIPGSASAHLANLRIQQLHQEREAMRVRREQLAANSRVSQVMEESLPSNIGTVGGILGVDPFLGSDNHSRQESGDSGLGLGFGALPRSSENLLNDSTDVHTGINNHHQRQASFGNNNNNHVTNNGTSLMSVHGSTNVDSNMDSSNDLGLDSLAITSMEFGCGVEQMDEDFMHLPVELEDIDEFLAKDGGLL